LRNVTGDVTMTTKSSNNMSRVNFSGYVLQFNAQHCMLFSRS